MGDWNQICNNEEEVGVFIKTMVSEYTPWKVLPPPYFRKFPVTLDIKRVGRKKVLQIVKVK